MKKELINILIKKVRKIREKHLLWSILMLILTPFIFIDILINRENTYWFKLKVFVIIVNAYNFSTNLFQALEANKAVQLFKRLRNEDKEINS